MHGGALIYRRKDETMPLNWMRDIRSQSIDALLLMEECQLEWIPEDYLRRQWAIVLRARPHIAWFITHKCPAKARWIGELMSEAAGMPTASEAEVQSAGGDLLQAFEDWITYALDPGVYAGLPHNGWDERELTDMCDFAGKRVIDIGPGTGKQTFALAGLAREVYGVEPVGSLRRYLRREAARRGCANVHVVDGLMDALPFEDGFADAIVSGHVFGDQPDAELREMLRALRPGGMLVLIPGNVDRDNDIHAFLIAHGFDWARFEEPQDGMKRKYWLIKQ